MNDKQCEYITSVIKIGITVAMAGIATGRLFDARLELIQDLILIVITISFIIIGYSIQKE